MDGARNLRSRDNKGSVHTTELDTDDDNSDSESPLEESLPGPSPMSLKGFEAFLEVQTRFLQQQTELAKADEKRREDLFQEQLKQAKATEEEQQRRQDLYEQQLKQAEHVDTEEQWRKELHIAQMKEFEDRGKLIKLQENQASELKEERARDEGKRQKLRRADRIQNWQDEEDPECFFDQFEELMTECDIPKEEWRSRLVACLTGKALMLYRARTGGSSMEETFDALKKKLLIAMGHGLQQTRQKFWRPPRKNLESPTETIRTLSIYLNRITKDCNDVELFREEILLGHLMTLYPMDLADEVYRSKPSNAFEAADFLQSYLDSHPWRKKNLNKCKEVSGLGEGSGESGGDPGRTGYSMEYQGRKGHNSKDGRYESRDIDDKGFKQDWERTITCFGCGVKGHRKSECPEKVARVVEKGSPKSKILKGTIGKTPCELTLDSGADRTVVREDLVSHHEYTGKTSTVGDYFGYWRKVPTALVWIGIEGEYKFRQEVLVVPRDCAHQGMILLYLMTCTL